MISLKSHYGLKAIVALAANYGKGYIQAKKISDQQDIPLQYLQLLLYELFRAQIITSKRGRHGGYILSKKPDKITVWDVVVVFEGKIIFAQMESPTGTKKTPGPYIRLWQEAEKKMVDYLKSIKVSTLLNRVKKSS